MSNVKYSFSDDGKTGYGWLSDGTRFLFDAEDFEKIRDINWYRNLNNGDTRRLYITTQSGVYLHRYIIPDVPSGYEVDHISLDTLDNRKCNLRFCYTQKNAFNRKKPQVECTSRYKGVLRRKNTVSWTARIKYCETCIELGTYPTEEIAAAVYNLAAAIFFGEFRRENILDDSIKLSVFDTEKVMKRCHKAITTRRLNVKTERYTDYLASMRA